MNHFPLKAVIWISDSSVFSASAQELGEIKKSWECFLTHLSVLFFFFTFYPWLLLRWPVWSYDPECHFTRATLYYTSCVIVFWHEYFNERQTLMKTRRHIPSLREKKKKSYVCKVPTTWTWSTHDSAVLTDCLVSVLAHKACRRLWRCNAGRTSRRCTQAETWKPRASQSPNPRGVFAAAVLTESRFLLREASQFRARVRGTPQPTGSRERAHEGEIDRNRDLTQTQQLWRDKKKE